MELLPEMFSSSSRHMPADPFWGITKAVQPEGRDNQIEYSGRVSQPVSLTITVRKPQWHKAHRATAGAHLPIYPHPVGTRKFGPANGGISETFPLKRSKGIGCHVSVITPNQAFPSTPASHRPSLPVEEYASNCTELLQLITSASDDSRRA